jgi:predicted DCC family thiol-disulfide oxidoreductase YuxK
VPDDGAALLVYDGDCSFCSSAAKWVSAKWTRSRLPEAVPWQRLGQNEMDRLGLTVRDVKRAAWWIEDGRQEGGHRAVARALMAVGGGWRLAGRPLLIPPVECLAALGYRIVASNRSRLPGGSPACSP